MNDDFLRAEKLVDSLIEKYSQNPNYSQDMIRVALISVLSTIMEERTESYEFCRSFVSTVNSRL